MKNMPIPTAAEMRDRAPDMPTEALWELERRLSDEAIRVNPDLRTLRRKENARFSAIAVAREVIHGEFSRRGLRIGFVPAEEPGGFRVVLVPA